MLKGKSDNEKAPFDNYKSSLTTNKLSLRKKRLNSKLIQKRIDISISNFSNEFLDSHPSSVLMSRLVNLVPHLMTSIPTLLPTSPDLVTYFSILSHLSGLSDPKYTELLLDNDIMNIISEQVSNFFKSNYLSPLVIGNLILLIGNIASHSKEVRLELHEINAVEFLVYITRTEKKENILWAISNLVEEISFDSMSISFVSSSFISYKYIDNFFSMISKNKINELYYSIKIQYNLLKSNSFHFDFFILHRIFDKFFNILIILSIRPEALVEENNVVILILDIVNEIIINEDEFPLINHIVTKTKMLSAFSELLSKSDLPLVIRNNVLISLSNIVAIDCDEFTDEICENEELIKNLFKENDCQSFFCIAGLTSTSNKTHFQKLIEKGIDVLILKVFDDNSTTSLVKCYAYEALYNLLEYLSFSKDKICEYLKECCKRGIKEKIEKDSSSIDKSLQLRASRVYELFFKNEDEIKDDFYNESENEK